jgi:hypothetical protein
VRLQGSHVSKQEQSIQKRIDELSVQRTIAARVLDWLESDVDFQKAYGSDSRDRYAAAERERIAQLDLHIAGHKRSLLREPLVNITELRALQERAAEAAWKSGSEFALPQDDFAPFRLNDHGRQRHQSLQRGQHAARTHQHRVTLQRKQHGSLMLKFISGLAAGLVFGMYLGTNSAVWRTLGQIGDLLTWGVLATLL